MRCREQPGPLPEQLGRGRLATHRGIVNGALRREVLDAPSGPSGEETVGFTFKLEIDGEPADPSTFQTEGDLWRPRRRDPARRAGAPPCRRPRDAVDQTPVLIVDDIVDPPHPVDDTNVSYRLAAPDRNLIFGCAAPEPKSDDLAPPAKEDTDEREGEREHVVRELPAIGRGSEEHEEGDRARRVPAVGRPVAGTAWDLSLSGLRPVGRADVDAEASCACRVEGTRIDGIRRSTECLERFALGGRY